MDASVPARDFPFRVEVTAQGATAHVAVFGDVDLGTADSLAAEIDAVLEHQTPDALILDLRGVTFMDSSGLAILISLKARMNTGALRVVVVRGGPPVQRPITIAGLDQQFEFVDEPGEAVAGF